MYADQPAFAEVEARFRGEAVRVRGRRTGACSNSLDLKIVSGDVGAAAALGRTWTRTSADGAALIHSHRPGNVLVRGRVTCGNVTVALAAASLKPAANSSPGSWNTPTSSQKRGSRAGWATPSKCKPVPKRRTWIAPTSQRF